MITSKKSIPKLLPRSVQSSSKHKMTKRYTKTTNEHCQTPVQWLRSLFGNSCQVNDRIIKVFKKPSQEDLAAYDLEAVKAIRERDLEQLRAFHKQGRSLNACNQFGESLLHMACRRGDRETVSFLIREAEVRVDIRDDFGRTPIHDACWTSNPNFEVMDILISAADPYLLLAEDVRGSTPFDYARREHYSQWIKFLESREESLLRRIRLMQALASELCVNSC